eukprot:GHVH01004772.1.p1 GENE.GHVH01004772.1~~GHVH01004772.1.p1  ORF type:complete len:430 (+),score=74.43 GHVH01004772.1:66-1355(+)
MSTDITMRDSNTLSSTISWPELLKEHASQASGDAIVEELLSTVNHDFENLLYYDVLESVDDLLFNDLTIEYWTKVGHNKKVELLLCIATFVKDHCKHFKIAKMFIQLSREDEISSGLELLGFCRELCNNDGRAEFILIMEEADVRIKSVDTEVLPEIFHLCELKLKKLQAQQSSAATTLTAAIFADFHSVAYQYHIIMGNYESAYTHVRLCLQYKDLNDIPNDIRVTIACVLMLSGLVAENIFAFGDILEQPIVQWLSVTTHMSVAGFDEATALKNILKAYDEANIVESHKSLDAMIGRAEFKFSDVVVSFKQTLQLKLELMVILDICFSKPRGTPVITFAEITEKTHIRDPIAIQHLLIKAMGKELIKGSIDSTNETVSVQWTKPQAINVDRAGLMARKYSDLVNQAESLIGFMTDQAGSTLLNADTL